MEYPFARPIYVMAKPAGAACNMRCEYCYYTEKAGLYPQVKREVMTEATLECFIQQYLQAQTSPHVQFVWHGGEALMRSLSFYRKAMELQQSYGRGFHIENCLQTNGLLLTEEWCRFLRDNHWLVGISIDGPAEYHDEYRRTTAGGPSHSRVMRAIEMLTRHDVDWNALAVVNDYNADHPQEFYHFFRDIGCQYLQFTPIVERVKTTKGPLRLASVAESGELAPFSLTPEQWGKFLCGVFDEWVRRDVGQIYVQLFDATLANYVGQEPGICTLSATCGHAAALEHNGDLYSCDHFVFPEYRLGNIASHTIVEMMMSPAQLQFATQKLGSLPHQCHVCEFLSLCHGECPKNRFAVSADGEPGLNYLCAGYRQFFTHTRRHFQFMASQLQKGLPPALIMTAGI